MKLEDELIYLGLFVLLIIGIYKLSLLYRYYRDKKKREWDNFEDKVREAVKEDNNKNKG